MSVSTEDAIRIAILNHPETFGLSQVDVNPLLLYSLRSAEQEEGQGGGSDATHCFELCQANLHRKVIELLFVVKLVRSNAVIATEPERELSKAVAAEGSNGHHEATSVAVLADKLTTKQLRYMGFLYRQLGEEPDYKNDISRLSQVQATMRIKELEKRLGR